MKRELLASGLAGDGQLGLRPTTDQQHIKVPDHIVGAPSNGNGSSVISVACGEKHTLFLANDGKVWSVGGNDHGQLGRGPGCQNGSFTIYPVNLTGVRIIQIACGRAHSMAVAEDGRLFGWGSNEHGQLATSNHIKSYDTPKRIQHLTEVVQVACGPDHCICLCENGMVFVWGQKWDGANCNEPEEVSELIGIPIIRVEAGGCHCIALSASGQVFTWGQNDYGQLGNRSTLPSTIPVRVEAVDNMRTVDIAAGYSHSVLLTRDGRVFVFGSDQFGQCGFGRKLDRRSTPAVIPDLMGSHVSRIACGRCHTLVVIAGKLYSFGLGSSGQLANGLERNQISPRLTDESLDHVASIFAGWDQSFFMRQGGVFDVNSGPSATMKYPKFLSCTRITELIEKHEKLDLIELLESVFSSFSCLNGSFLYNDDRRFMTSDRCSGLDLDAVMDSFNLLSSTTDRQQYSDLILDSCKMSIFADVASTPIKYLSVECLRAFLILPWLDAFVVNVTKETVRNLHMSFAVVIQLLTADSRKMIEKWWIGLPRRHFNRLVAAMLAGARRAILEKWTPMQIKPIMDILDTLNYANKHSNTIPLESFYIQELNDNVNLANDFAVFRTDPSKRNWCWSNHSYILNGIAKADVLHVEAILKQHHVVSMDTYSFLGLTVHTQLPFFCLRVHRNNILQDTMTHLMNGLTQKDLLKPLKVEFIGEEGEDAGGVKKEFFMLLFQKLLTADYGMFVEDPESHLIWFSGLPLEELDDESMDRCFAFVGLLCAMAIYNGVLVNLPFPLALYKMILGQKPLLEDLTELYPTTGKGLEAMLAYEEPDFEDVFGLNFTIDYKLFDKPITEELKSHGTDLIVKQENKMEYVKLFVEHKLEIGMQGRIKKEIEMFINGFKMLIQGETLEIFQPRELQEMIIGNENYDWTEFKKVVQYKDEYHANHPVIKCFWEAFFRLTLDERKKFMQFLMGSPRLPVKGLSAVDIAIQPCADHLLPAAHTCANLLDLPKTTDPDEMYRRLLISIEHTEGFTLA